MLHKEFPPGESNRRRIKYIESPLSDGSQRSPGLTCQECSVGRLEVALLVRLSPGSVARGPRTAGRRNFNTGKGAEDENDEDANCKKERSNVLTEMYQKEPVAENASSSYLRQRGQTRPRGKGGVLERTKGPERGDGSTRLEKVSEKEGRNE